MSSANQYKWLFIVEGYTDVETFSQLFNTYGISLIDISLFSAHGKGFVCNAETWSAIHKDVSGLDLLSTLKNDIGRSGFKGVILIVDSDVDNEHAFDTYKRYSDNTLYTTPSKSPTKKAAGGYWLLDELKGVDSIPIIGINVPMNKSGCLETDLLDSYSFPIEGQDEYNAIVDVITKASPKWNIPKLKGGNNWWDENKKAKLDKFIYSALSRGFSVCRQTPQLPTEPDVLVQIKNAIT